MFESSRPDQFFISLNSSQVMDRSRRTLLALAVAAPLALSGCSSLEFLNTVSGAPAVEPVTLRYGASPRQQVDIYPQPLPKGTAAAPVVVFFYGGAWASGARDQYAFVARTFHRLGYVVAIPDYRLYPEVVYPGFVQDSADALRAIIDRVGALGGDPQRVVLMGHSAGAYNASMIAMDTRWLSSELRRSVRGVIGLSAPVNFLPIQMPEAQRAFSWPNTPRESQPIAHVSASVPPMLLITAERDPLVDPEINSRALAARLKAVGADVDVQTIAGPLGLMTHAGLVATLSERFAFLAPTIDAVRGFIERVTQ